VMLAVMLLGALFLWTSHRRSPPPHGQTSFVASANVVEAPLPPPVASPSAAAIGGTDATLDRSAETVQDVAAVGDPHRERHDVASQPVLAYVGTSSAGERRAALPDWTRQADAHGPIR